MDDGPDAGEREALQRVARETGERMGGMDAVIAAHTDHLNQVNGSIATLATKMTETATSVAVMQGSVAEIQRSLNHKTTSHESRLTVIEAWIAEARGNSKAHRASQGISLQWALAIFAAAMGLIGVFLVLAVTVVLYALG